MTFFILAIIFYFLPEVLAAMAVLLLITHEPFMAIISGVIIWYIGAYIRKVLGADEPGSKKK